MTSPVIRITGDGGARVVSLFGPVRVTEPGATQPWTGERSLAITATGERTIADAGGRLVDHLIARAGELTDVTVVLHENGTPLGDLGSAVVGWDATRDGAHIFGSGTGAAAGTVTLHLDVPAETLVGAWMLTISVDGVTWPTTRDVPRPNRRRQIFMLQIKENR